MKKLLLCAAASLCLCSQAYDMLFDGANLKQNEQKTSLWIFAKEKGPFGGLKLPKEDENLVSMELKGDELIVDTRAFYEKYKTGKTFMIGWHGIRPDEFFCSPKAEKNPKKINRMEVICSGPAGAGIDLLVLSNKGAHFWRMKREQLSGKENEKLSFETPVIDGVENIWLRTDLKAPGIYRFRSLRFFSYEKRKSEQAVDSSVNHIRNGGAEDGFNSIVTISLDFAKHTLHEKHIDWRKIVIDSQNDISLDSATAHTGRYSFRVEKKTDFSYGRLHFNPVPYRAGQPTSFTVYMKSDRPMSVEMGLFLGNGQAAAKRVAVGKEWKKYELYMPSWGMKGEGFQVFGDLVNAYPRRTEVVMPYVAPADKSQGTLWVDSASYAIGGHSEFRDDAPVHLRAEHAHKNGYYYAGETVHAEAEAENYTGKPLDCSISYVLKDWTGKPVFQSPEQKFSLDGKKKFSFEILPPSGLRGAANLTFVCKAGGKTAESTLYFGIIEKNQNPDFRSGIEVGAMQNMKLLMPYFKDFRIGAIRNGTASGSLWYSFEQLPYLKSQGIKTMLCVSMDAKERDNPELWNAWLKKFEAYVQKYAGLLEIYETQNEPNISGWSVDKNWKQIDDMGRIVKKYDPQAKIGGPVANQIDFTWIAAILAKDKNNLLDYITYHPYRLEPELPDYAEEAVRLQKMTDTFRKIPQMATEAGVVVPPALADQKITDYVRISASRAIRNMIHGYAGGAERYYLFCLDSTHCGSGWNLLFMGNPGTDNMPVPNITFFALRNLIDRLETAAFSGRARLGLNYRCFVFDHGKKRTAALWKWKGEPSVMRFSKADAAKLTAYDLLGNRISAEVLDLTPHPVYLESELSTAELVKLIENASLTNNSGTCVEVEPAITDARKFRVHVRNITGRPFDCTVTVLNADEIEGSAKQILKGIPGEDSGSAEFLLKNPVSTSSRKIKLQVEVPSRKEKRELAIDLRGILAYKTAAPLKIDGDLSDWSERAAAIRLDSRNTDPRDHKNWGAAENAVTANLRYAWDDNNLYAAIEVFKPELHALPDVSLAGNVWCYDSVQVCFDPLRNAPADRESLDDDDFEYSIGMMGKEARVYRRWASSAMYDSLNKEQGLLPADEVPVAIRKYADRTVYEIAFPRRAVSPFKLMPHSAMRLGTLVNLNNGKERTGYLELTPGIGYRKMPGQWMDLVLLP